MFNDLLLELLYRLIGYLPTNNYWALTLINKDTSHFRLERFIYISRIKNNYADYEDLTSKWYQRLLKNYDYKAYLDDIYYSIFINSLDPPKKLLCRRIIFKKTVNNYRGFRDILYYNRFKLIDDNIPKLVIVHSMYRVDLVSYLRLKQKHPQVLALIY